MSISFARNQFPPAIIRHVRARREVRSAAFVKVQGEGMRMTPRRSAYCASLDMVAWLTLNRRARSACVTLLAASAARASCCWCFVSFGGRPIRTPRARARFLPSPVRARMSSRSNSASPPSTVSINRPCGVVVSAHVSANERNPAPAFAIVSTMLRRSRVDRASLSSRVTSRVSPAAMVFRARASSLRSAFAPLAVSR